MAFNQGRRADGARLAQEGMAIAREVGLSFAGAYALALTARASDDPEQRDAALAEGESILRKGSIGHDHFWFYQAAGECRIEASQWREGRRCAEQLRAFTEEEPIPLLLFIAARIDALCAVGSGERSERLRDELDRLIAEANRFDYQGLLPALLRARTEVGDRQEAGAAH